MGVELAANAQTAIDGALVALLAMLLNHFRKNRESGRERDKKVEQTGHTVAEALAVFGGKLDTHAARTDSAVSAVNARVDRIERGTERNEERIHELELELRDRAPSQPQLRGR